MDHRGHPWPDSDHHYKPKDRGDYYKWTGQDRDQSCPPPVPRDWDRHWTQPDPHYRTNSTRLEQYPYSAHLFPYDHGQPDHQRPQSRHGYDYPSHSHWDYRDNYGYYDHDYYRGQRGPQDTGQWDQYSQRHDQYHVRKYKQDHIRSSYSEENRSNQGRDTSQPYLSDYEENPSRENEEVSSFCLGTLESSKTSGLSSSSYELSQYMNGAEHADPVPPPAADHDPVPHMSAPLKYSIPHVAVSFGHAGQLIRVTPNFSTQRNISQLEVHSLEVILSETQEQQEMRNFPGPLTREDLHKVDAIEFAQQKAGACMRDDQLHDQSSAALLWNLLILLCRQNGQIVGSDIAELLMQGSRSDGGQEADAATLIDFSESPTAEAAPQQEDDLLTGNSSSFSSDSSEKALQSYTQLLLAGRKKEALESAMSSGLWGHALFLASKMNSRSYTTVLNRFTGQLAASDPLQTLFHLLSGRIPAVATSCGNEKSGDWRPHLSVMLSNESGDPGVHQKAIVTMGDTLASRGLVHAAHVCYLTAGVPFGSFTQKAERLVLLGSSHKQSFEDFATNSAIQCTELYEYCQTLGDKRFSIPSFQVYKFLYACRLFDCGLAAQAFHYCEVVGQAILRQREPFFVLTGEVIKLADRLRYSEGQFNEAGVSGAVQEPDWLKQLRARHHGFQMGNYQYTETHQPAPEGCAHEDRTMYSESGSDNVRSDSQSPEPELSYIDDSMDPEGLAHQTGGITEQMTTLPCDIRGAGEWPFASPSVPASLVYVPPAPAAASSQDLSYHNTDSAEVRAASAHCLQTGLRSAAEAAGSSSGIGMTLDVNMGQQPNSPQSLEQMDSSQQSKRGWFSGWFQSKPKDPGPAQTAPPPGCQ